MKTFAFIFARGGSKGIPNKNILPFAGKPLLAWSIEIAKEIPEVNRIFVSTDSPQIAEIAKEWGADVIERPVELAQDDSPEWPAWQHAVRWVKRQYNNFGCFISLPSTAPLRSISDIQACRVALDKQTDMVITMAETSRSPWFNMVRYKEGRCLSLLMEGKKSYTRRQDVPQAYDMTTVAYVTRPSFILKHSCIWDGQVKGVLIRPERAIDIDTPLDFKIAEFLLKERKKIGITNAE